MTKKVKILQLLPTDSLGIDGLSKHIISAFQEEPYDITTAYLYTPAHPIIAENIISFNFKKSDTKGLRLKALWQIFSFCRKEKFDVIITHRFKPLHMMLILNKLLRVPVCFSVIHGFDDFKRSYRRFLIKSLWDKNWGFIGVSEPVSHYLMNIFNNPTSVTTINNCIDIQSIESAFFTAKNSKKKLNLREKSFVFGTIGRLVPLKGHIYLIQAFEKTLIHHPDSQLVIIGEGRERKNIETYIQEKKLHTSVILAGHLDDAYMLLKALDVFILPSQKEGFGLVLLEAMAAKLPIIAHKTGGIPAVLGPLGTLYAPATNIESLSEEMTSYINLPQSKLNDIKQALHTRLCTNFSLSNYKNQYRNLVGLKLKEHMQISD